MDRDIAAVMVTVDRSPGKNYLAETLENLKRGGLLDSERLASFEISSSGADVETNWAFHVARDVLGYMRLQTAEVMVMTHHPKVCANVNVAAALRLGLGAEWVLFMEDDIDVCAHFFDSVGSWLDCHAQEQYRVYPFGSAYSSNGSTVVVPQGHFYGTQCFAIRASDAKDLADFLEEKCYSRTQDGTAYDLLMSDWVGERYPAWKNFLASSPSFVQHIGRESVIRPRPNVHKFQSWPGRDWSYA